MTPLSSATNDFFDPYHKLLGIPQEEQPPTHYRLLGVVMFEADPEVLDMAADKQMSYLHGCRNGEHAEEVEQLLNEISSARLCLLNPKSKSQYDQMLRTAMAAVAAISRPTHQEIREPVAAVVTPVVTPTIAPSRPIATPAVPVVQVRPTSKRSTFRLSTIINVFVLASISLATYWIATNVTITKAKVTEEMKAALDSTASDLPHARSSASTANPSTVANEPIDATSAERQPTNPLLEQRLRGYESDRSRSQTGVSNTASDLMSDDLPFGDPARSSSTTNKPRLPAPSPADVSAATAEIETLYKNDLAKAKYAVQQTDAARRAIEVGITSDDPASQFALFQYAVLVASKAGDQRTTFEAIEQIESRFENDPLQAKMDAMERLVKVPRTDMQWLELIAVHDDMIGDALRIRDFELASRISKIGTEIANDLRNVEVSKHLAEQRKRVEDSQQSHAKVLLAHETLAKTPNHPTANEFAGKYYCFLIDDWETGLPFLALAENGQLRKLAAMETASTASNQRRRMLADAWWEFAESSTVEVIKSSAQKRALHWYQRGGINELRGLEREKVINRIQQISSASSSHSLAQAMATSTSKRPAPTRPRNVPADAIHWRENWYWFPPKEMSFEEVKRFLAQSDGRLLVIASEEENQFIASQIKGETLLGVQKVDNKWINNLGDEQPYFNWSPSRNPTYAKFAGMEHVAILNDGFWREVKQQASYYVCIEWGHER